METTTLEQKVKEAEDILDEFENIHHLSRVTIPNEIEKILNISYEQLEKLQHIQCAEYAYQLAQYSYYIQRVYNKESARLKWFNNQLQNLTADKLNNYDQYTKYEVKIRLIAKENAVVMRLIQLMNQSEQKMERMSFLGTSISRMSDTMNNLQRAKQQQIKAG